MFLKLTFFIYDVFGTNDCFSCYSEKKMKFCYQVKVKSCYLASIVKKHQFIAKNVFESRLMYELILENIKIQYYAKLTCLYRTIYYGKFGRDKV